MDPEVTLAELLTALGRRDWQQVDELADALLDWMERGGFPPVTLGPKSLGPNWHRAQATFACYQAKSRVRDARKRRNRKA